MLGRIRFLRRLRQGFSTVETPQQKYVIPSRIGGHSKENLFAIYAKGMFKNHAIENVKHSIPGATILTKPQQCKRCVQKLMETDTVVAWDTQTIDLDVKQQAPVHNGRIICASFFAGPQYDFGNGPRVMIDNFGSNAGLIDYFKDYLQNENYKKVWHNYGFDRHIFYNHNINVRGFGGDTMHMARLQDASKLPGQYSLASLTKSFKTKIQQKIKTYLLSKQLTYTRLLEQSNNQVTKQQLTNKIQLLLKYKKEIIQRSFTKRKLEDLFFRKKILIGGTQGKILQFPNILTLHTSPQYIKDWIQYSLLDAESTFFLRELLEQLLSQQKSNAFQGYEDMWKLYREQWLPLGQVLTDMQRKGFKIDVQHMEKIKIQAQEALETKKNQFLQFVGSIQNDPNIQFFNPASSQQMQQLLHAPYKIGNVKIIKDIKDEGYDYEQKEVLQNAVDEDKPKKAVRKQVVELPQSAVLSVPNPHYNKENKASRAKVDIKIDGLGIPPVRLTPKLMPSVDEEAIKLLAGNPREGKYGKAYQHFASKGQQQLGIKICEALYKLVQYRSIETLHNTFIEPLIGYVDHTGRIHCSLNMNTETGRLSSRKPNLQNQPALEKDIYKIRKGFVAEAGKKLIVADYGQLELRVLAHISKCYNMIKAFEEGGDFHSRTAIGMYDYIKKQMDQGKVLLEWDKSKGAPPVPLIKDKFAAERRKAKTVNFSIAYGKTAKGFADDWKCSIGQAKKVINAWFNERTEVKIWQKNMKELAAVEKITRTLLGRKRKLDRFYKTNKGMMERRAVNTPIQGGAADIVIAAMVNIGKNQRLKQLGWDLQLQVHDELILEGPQDSAQQALQIVKHSMSHPFHQDLLIELEIDAKIGTNWYQCK